MVSTLESSPWITLTSDLSTSKLQILIYLSLSKTNSLNLIFFLQYLNKPGEDFFPRKKITCIPRSCGFPIQSKKMWWLCYKFLFVRWSSSLRSWWILTLDFRSSNLSWLMFQWFMGISNLSTELMTPQRHKIRSNASFNFQSPRNS